MSRSQGPDTHATRRRRRGMSAAAVLLPLLVLAGCSGNTTPPQGVTRSNAWLHATVSCASGEHCSAYFRWGQAGSALSNKTATLGPFDGPVDNFDFHQQIGGLQPNVTYAYQICGNSQQGNGFVCVGPNGSDTQQQFTTPTFVDSFEGATFPQVFQTGAWCGDCGSGANGKLLDGSGAYFNQVTPSGYSADDGSKVAEAGLTTTSTRAEIQCHSTAPSYQCAGGEGSELFYRWSFRIPSNVTIPDQPFPTRPNIMQTKPSVVACYGGGMVIRPVAGDSTRVDLRQNIRGGTITDPSGSCTLSSADTLYSLGNFTKDAWHDVLLHAKWSESGSGFEEMWIDGVQVMPRQTRPTLIHGAASQMFRLGLYNSVNDAGGTNWHVDYDNVSVGLGSP